MAARYELEARIISATNLKNVNRRQGELKPYADVSGGPSYRWNQKLLIPFSTPILESTLHIDEATIGSAGVALRGVGLGIRAERTLQLKPQGQVEVELSVRELGGIRKGSGVYAVARAFGGIALTDEDNDDDADDFGYYESVCGTEDEDSDADDGTEDDDDSEADNDTDDDYLVYHKDVRVKEVDDNDCYFGYDGAFRGTEDLDEDSCLWDGDFSGGIEDGLEDDAYFDDFWDGDFDG